MPPMTPMAPLQRNPAVTPQANNQRNAITTALMNIANPPPKRPPMPQLSMANTMPQQQPITSQLGPQVAPPGSLPMGMPQDPMPGQPGAFPTPPTNLTRATPFTPMAGSQPQGASIQPQGSSAQQGMMPQQPQGQTGQGAF